jgi:O-antigen/teichoic acid export membrane protein
VIAFPCFVGLAAVSHNLILGLFGEKWLPAVWPTRVLCVWGLIYCIGVLQASLINSLGRAKWWFRYQLASNILNVPIVVLAAPHGVTTMLVVLAVKAYLIWCVPVWLTLKLLSMSASDYMRQFLAPLLAATAMGFAAILAPYAVHLGSPTALLALQIGAGAFTYALVLFGLARGRVVSLLDLFRGFRRPGVTAP